MKMILASQNKHKLAELSEDEKNSISHRANALVIFREFLKAEEDTSK